MARIVNIWNSLLNLVVEANSVSAFKVCLDKLWLHQYSNKFLLV